MNLLRSILSVLASMAVLTIALPVSAADPGSRSNGAALTAALTEEAQRWLRVASFGPTVASEPTHHSASGETAERTSPEHAAAAQPPPLFDLSPHASLVARDWRGSTRLVGNRTMLVDDLRPTASNRMVFARLATDARFSGFVQAGVGEWRIDTAMFPAARCDSEIAAQIGVGFELHLPRGMRVAGEAQYTMLSRDLHYSADEAAPRMASLVVAVAGHF